MTQLDGTGMKRLHRQWRRQTAGRLALYLDSVQTPFNVGAIIRTAAAYRVEHLWLSGSSEQPTHAKVRKTALGTDRYLTWSYVEEPLDAVAQIRHAGYQVVAVELTDDAEPLHLVDLRSPTCLVLGHEDRGVGKDVLAAADHTVHIPQVGRVGSLNVASAAAIAIYEVRRQEWTGETVP